jgi:hypothetical protein
LRDDQRGVFATLANDGQRATCAISRGNLGAMRFASLVAIACACGGASPPAPHVPTPAAAEFTAAKWIPPRPTYAIAAKSLRDVQRATTDLMAQVGVLVDVDGSELGQALARMLVVNPMVPDQLTAIGIDVEGGFAVFSEGIDPTLVVRVSGPDQLATFFQRQRERGMKTSSLMAGNVEVFSTKVSAGLTLSWALDGDWMWLHFGTPLGKEPDWFESSHRATPPAWADRWKRAAVDAPKLAGFVDVRALLGKLPEVADALACVDLIRTVGAIGFSVASEGTFTGISVAADVGPAAEPLRKALLPPPEGFDATARRAPLAAQWNLDLAAVHKSIAPCVKVAGFDPFGEASTRGIRAVRAILMSFDPDDSSGTGAVAVDLASTQLVSSLLDRIPMRSTLESPKAFGPYAGKSISIPLGPTLEYVVTDSLAIAGVGDGVLARVIGKGPGPPTTTILGLDILPAGLSADAWAWLFDRANIPARKRGVLRLQRWRDLHVSLRLDGTLLVLQATGNRG